MKRLSGILLGLSLVFGAAGTVAAQDKSAGMHAPPPVLSIIREYLKPGKGGSLHEATESMYVKAMTSANDPTHYIGMDAMTGRSRSLFFTGFDSFAAWEKEFLNEQKNPTLSAALDSAGIADGELLESYEQSVWAYREDQSYNQNGGLVGIRYFEIEVFHLKPGHEEDWNAAVKLVRDAYMKGMPDSHWAMYENVWGAEAPAFLVITPRKSAAEIDTMFSQNKKFMDALGADGMKKLSELSASAIASSETNFFAINPRISYMGDDLAKADPEFWAPKH
jgi:hypothetical protein